MADFQQRMKDWQRMCYSMQGGIRKCDNCPLFMVLCQYKPNEKADFEEAEQIIENWAAEHPEPVYPTWSEWLYEQGVLGDKYVCNIPALIASNVATDKVNDPIPADIAQKLGLQPKEG